MIVRSNQVDQPGLGIVQADEKGRCIHQAAGFAIHHFQQARQVQMAEGQVYIVDRLEAPGAQQFLVVAPGVVQRHRGLAGERLGELRILNGERVGTRAVQVQHAQELAAIDQGRAQPTLDVGHGRIVRPARIVVAVVDEQRLAGLAHGADCVELHLLREHHVREIVRRMAERARELELAGRTQHEERAAAGGDQPLGFAQHDIDDLFRIEGARHGRQD